MSGPMIDAMKPNVFIIPDKDEPMPSGAKSAGRLHKFAAVQAVPMLDMMMITIAQKSVSVKYSNPAEAVITKPAIVNIFLVYVMLAPRLINRLAQSAITISAIHEIKKGNDVRIPVLTIGTCI